jgi:predicted nucleic acid-binding protein
VTTATLFPGFAFIDTNVWLYAFITGQDPVKAQRARTIVAQTQCIVVSTQVINEVCVNLIRREHFSPAQVRDLIHDFYAAYTVVELGQAILLAATDLLSQYSLSYWDSLIVAGALASDAPVLYSEDMQHGLFINQRLTIINPLK